VYNVSSLIASSWKEHYKGMLDSGFLSSISHDGWADFLDKGMADGSFVCIVAESGGMLLGTAVMRSGSIRKMQGYGELSSLYVKPGETRRGIGSLLLKNPWRI
jgi:L-amino acid N-acyltransferase YncA